MVYLYSICGAALLLSFIFNKAKTLAALKTAMKKFVRLVPPFLVLTVFIAVALYLIPEDLISKALGRDNLLLGVATSSLLGSIAFIPGFIVFPLCGLLREQGVSFTVLSSFTTTLMMVGVLTFPLEREYLGIKLTIARNIAGFVMALLVALITGLIFGEIVI
jgi:uncharacterized membrane protein YraQ (UPF0718 family)